MEIVMNKNFRLNVPARKDQKLGDIFSLLTTYTSGKMRIIIAAILMVTFGVVQNIYF